MPVMFLIIFSDGGIMIYCTDSVPAELTHTEIIKHVLLLFYQNTHIQLLLQLA